jgi:hypothetical protein
MSTKYNNPRGVYGDRRAIDTVHERGHEGLVFTATYAETIGSGSTSSVMITKPAASDIHMTMSVESSGAGTWTWSTLPNATGGSTIVSNNHKASSTTVDPMLGGITSGPTVTSAGTILERHVIGSTGVGQSSSGGAGLVRNEWVMDETAATKHLIQFTASAATNIAYNITYYNGAG